MSSLAQPNSDRSCTLPASQSQSVPQPPTDCEDSAPLEFLQQLLSDQMRRWTTSEPLTTEQYLQQLISPDTHIPWTLELAAGEYRASRVAGRPVSVASLCQRFPQIVPRLAARLYSDPQPPAEARFVCRSFRSEDSLGTVWGGTDRRTSASVWIRYAVTHSAAETAQLLQKYETLKAHPHSSIVPIVDCCSLPDGTLRLVTSECRGIPLHEQLQSRRPAPRDAVGILIKIASALEHLHSLGLSHLALSPQCIILEPDSAIPLLNCAPFPPHTDYLSPEQAADEEHRADYRSDLFSFAVICYELLTGVRPFRGRNPAEIRRQIAAAKHVPVRQVQPAIPILFAQICSSTLQRSMSDRCLTAAGIVQLMQGWLKDTSPRNSAALALPVPASLRPFDASGADSFPELLPGPRNQKGLPVSIAHWKSQIELRAPEPGFRVALFSGPAGTGKTSFVSAGLLPRLSAEILTIHADAAHELIELRLLTALREQHLIPRQDPAGVQAPASHQLTHALKTIRRAHGPAVLLVIDHFEHWLLQQSGIADTPLAQALQQCDGRRLQALLITDNKAMLSASRLMAALDIPLVQNQSHQAFDLLTCEQAERMLTVFGRTSAKLADQGQLSAEQQQFLQQAIQRLQQQSTVPQWQLALFMEQSRHLDWQPAALQAPGRDLSPLEFLLDQTFAQIQQQFPDPHTQSAALRLLEALLPEDQSSTIRPQRSQTDLIQYAGTDVPVATVNLLLQILSSHACLLQSFPGFPPRPLPQQTEPAPVPTIAEEPASQTADTQCENQPADQSLSDAELTATEAAPDPESSLEAMPEPESVTIPDVSWQLSHDFLITPLQQWLTRRKRVSRAGRAELLLAESLRRWNPEKHKRHLPSLSHWLQIVAFTDRRRWNEAQSLLLRRAEVLHIRRLTMLLVVALVVLIAATQGLRRYRAAELARGIVTAGPDQLPVLLGKADRVGELIDQYLQPKIIDSASANAEPAGKRADLAARLTLLPRHPVHAESLARSFLSVDISTAAVIRDRLLKSAPAATKLWQDTLLDSEKSDKRRFRAAVGLAGLPAPPAAEIWTPATLNFVALQLTSTFAEHQPLLRNLLKPIAPTLLPDLQQLCIAPSATTLQKTSAAAAIAQYAPDSPELLTDLLLQASPAQAELLIPPFAALKHQPSIARLQNPAAFALKAAASPPVEVSSELLHANAALTLAATDHHAEAGAPLRISRQAETVSQFAIRANQWNLTPGDLVLGFEFNERLRTQPGANQPANLTDHATCSFLLALSHWTFNRMPATVKETLPAYLKNLYENDPSAAVHSLSGWLLQHWGFHKLRMTADAVDVPYDPRSDRQWFRLNIPVPGSTMSSGEKNRSPFISLTFIVIPPGSYTIGSPPRTVTITAPFAICDRELPESIRRFWQQQSTRADAAGTASSQTAASTTDDPAASHLNWNDATQICRWLTRQYRGNDESWQCFTTPPDSNIRLDRLGFRLPTGDEWEVAASGNGAAKFACGNDPLLLPFFSWTSANASTPQTPASKPPTLNGLFDCHGNVSEWTVDAPLPGSRLHRGSSWLSTTEQSLLTTTFTSPETTAVEHIGLRIACTLPETRRRNTVEK
jgi:formylglycine-generating enzyme required for sulfatase activity